MKNKKLKNILINLILMIASIIFFLILAEVTTMAIYGRNIQFEYDSGLLWKIRPDQQGFTAPNSKLATINSDGFRGRDFQVYPEKYRIAMIGDSFTFGFGVEDNETLPFHLGMYLNEYSDSYDVYNFGVPGYGLYQMVSLYEHSVKDYEPDIVILTLIKGDLYRQPQTTTVQNKSYTIKFYSRYISRSILYKSSFFTLMKPRFSLFRKLIVGSKEYKSKIWRELWEYDKERIIRFNRELKQDNVSLIIVPYIYDSSQLDFLEEIQVLSAEENIMIVDDIFNRFEDFNSSQLTIQFDNHPSSLSYQLAAISIYEKIISDEKE